MRLTRTLHADQRGSAMITALIATVLMLGLGLALLSIVDTQASESATERTRDRAFNLSESVLNSEAFVLGRNWPTTGAANCGATGAGFKDDLGATSAAIPEVARLRPNLNASYTDAAYAGASWQVNICDDDAASTVWSNSLLTKPAYDLNDNDRVWVRAQSTVDGKTRAITGLVQVRSKPALPARFGLVAGNVTDDLGATVNNLATNALGGVLGGLLGTTPTVAPDPALPGSGLTGVRCGLLDLQVLVSTCVTGTVAALGAIPLVSTLLGDKYQQYPTVTTTSPVNIGQLRKQAQTSNSYAPTSPGGATPATAPACTIPAGAGASTIVFIEKVGTGDQWCVLNVPVGGLAYRAVVVGSGRIIVRGAPITAGSPVSPTSRTFTGVVYALNLQRHPVADGGLGLGDAAAPGREVVRLESGAHVKGGVYADGRSAKVGIYPPSLADLNMTQLRNAVCSPLPLVQRLLCFTLGGVGDILNTLGLGVLGSLVTGILDQLNPQRAQYGSAILTDRAAIEALSVYGASGVIPSSFTDLSAR